MTRLHESKGNSYLVEAARLVLDRRPHAKFLLVGEGPLRPALDGLGAVPVPHVTAADGDGEGIPELATIHETLAPPRRTEAR